LTVSTAETLNDRRSGRSGPAPALASGPNRTLVVRRALGCVRRWRGWLLRTCCTRDLAGPPG
jgi:hypothetical protein